MIITELEQADRPAWDAYVQNSADGLPQHLSGWRDVLSKAYGYETHYLMATEGGEVVGVLPLFVVRSVLVGDSVTTMPGGMCADNAQVAGALIASGREIAQQAGTNMLLIHDTRRVWPGDLHTTTHHVHWVVDVSVGDDVMWNELHRNIRRQVRMGRMNELTVKVCRTASHLDDFYHVLSRFLHSIGVPVFSRTFLEHVVRTFPDGFNIAMVYRDGRPIGGYFQLVMGKTVYGTWGATLHKYLESRAVYLAYWEMLRDTYASGYEHLDMGRSPTESNVSAFKGQWGGVAQPVYQQVATVRGQQHTSIVDRVHSGTKYQWVMRLWPRLPFPLVQFLGPKLRRHVPFA